MSEWKRILPFILGFSFSCVGCRDSSEPPKPHKTDFIVLSATGQVEVWQSLASKWHPLPRGSRLQIGQLVRIQDGGHLIMQEMQEVSNATKERTIFHGPLISRVGRIEHRLDLLDDEYRMEVKSFKGLSIGGSLVPYNKSLSSILEMLPDHPLTRKAQDLLGSTSEQKPQDMRLWLPSPKGVFRPAQFPWEVEVLWQSIPEHTHYHLYVWRSDENRGEPMVISHVNTYWLELQSYGSFSVQVTTADGAFATEVRKFHLSNPLEGSSTAISATTEPPKSIQLLVPKADMVFMMRRAPVAIPFSWKVPVTALPWDEYELRIETTGGELVHQAYHQRFETTISLNAGTYRWRVIGRNRGQTSQAQEVSEMRLLRVEGGTPGSWSTVMRELRGAFKSEFGQNIYLETL